MAFGIPSYTLDSNKQGRGTIVGGYANKGQKSSAQVPIYGVNGIIIGYHDGYGNKIQSPTLGLQTASGGGNAPVETSAGDDLSSWLSQNIPAYGGGNTPAQPTPVTSPSVPAMSLPTYAAPANKPAPLQPVKNTLPTIPQLPSVSALPSYNSGTETSSSGFRGVARLQNQTTTAPSSGMPQIPSYAPLTPTDPRIDQYVDQSLNNIGSGLRGELPGDVTDMLAQRAAERGAATGVGSGNSGAAYLRALGLTSLDLMQQAEKNLQPYQDRSASVNLANIAQGGENFRALLGEKGAMDRLLVSGTQEQQNQILRGNQALEQLKLQEAGQTGRQSQAERADLTRQILAGQQALDQINIKQGGDIAMTFLNAGLDRQKQLLSGEQALQMLQATASVQQQRDILEGAQAMQRLQLSESAGVAKISAQLKSQLQQQVLEGQQAFARLQASAIWAENAATVANNRARENAVLENQYNIGNENRAQNRVVGNAEREQQYSLINIEKKYALDAGIQQMKYQQDVNRFKMEEQSRIRYPNIYNP